MLHHTIAFISVPFNPILTRKKKTRTNRSANFAREKVTEELQNRLEGFHALFILYFSRYRRCRITFQMNRIVFCNFSWHRDKSDSRFRFFMIIRMNVEFWCFEKITVIMFIKFEILIRVQIT